MGCPATSGLGWRQLAQGEAAPRLWPPRTLEEAGVDLAGAHSSLLSPVRSGPLRMHPAHAVGRPVPVPRAVSVFSLGSRLARPVHHASPRPGRCVAHGGCSLRAPGGREGAGGLSQSSHTCSVPPSLWSPSCAGSVLGALQHAWGLPWDTCGDGQLSLRPGRGPRAPVCSGKGASP